MNLLQVEQLRVSFATERGRLPVLEGVDFSLEAGRSLGLVGESGCGKSITALSLMRLLPQPSGHVDSGRVLFENRDLLQLPPKAMRAVRGRRMAMIFQDPMTALNPVHTVGRQLGEIYRLHFPKLKPAQRRRHAIELLERVGIPSPEQRLRAWPHQLSGGMRQRVMIAMALACEPALLIADEPTTALDVTVQAQILELILELQRENGMALLFITHDLGVISEICDQVAVMYAGGIVERGPVDALFATPCHPYTRGLLGSIPALNHEPKSELATIPGQVPALDAMPAGCRFANRCPAVRERCRKQVPPLEAAGGQQQVACLRWRELDHA